VTMPDAFAYSLGPRKAKLAIVGEAWGESEERFKAPFVGSSGAELARMLSETELGPPISPGYINEPTMIAHWMQSGIFLTNVFAEHPPSNNLDLWCATKKELGPDYTMPPLKHPGKYVRPEFLHHLDRLYAELTEVKPNLILALGNTACWALLGQTAISSIRGTTVESKWGKVLPTFHPAAVLRNWPQRVIVLQDLLKAKREVEFPEVRRPKRWVLVNPTLDEVIAWADQPAPIYSVDIETHAGQITMIGFSSDPASAIVVPFVDNNGVSYWQNELDEITVWKIVKRVLEGPTPKLFQNGLYDLQFIYRMGIRPANCQHDTMLLHHSLYPELQKGLGFLGSIYTNESSWKLLRKTETMKKDE